MSYRVFSLSELLDLYGEEKVRRLLENFGSKNSDVEYFIRTKAVQFERVGVSRTSLVFDDYHGQVVIAGFFSLSNKPMILIEDTWNRLSNSTKKKLIPMGYKDKHFFHSVSSILLGQISKNFAYDDGCLIKGDELLQLTFEHVKTASRLIGGQVLYLEAEDDTKIDSFYTRNGFACLRDCKQRKLQQEDSNLVIYTQKINHL